MAGLLDLDFAQGIDFAGLVHQRFKCSVSPCSLPSPKAFLLVASFGRSRIKLNVDSVGIILQACLGGDAKNFNILGGWFFNS